jgi:hypothetical protein
MVDRTIVNLVRIADLIRPWRTIALIGRITGLAHGEGRSAAERQNPIDLPPSQKGIHDARCAIEEPFATSEREIIQPTEGQSLPDVLRAEAALLREISPVLDRSSLSHEGRVTGANAF